MGAFPLKVSRASTAADLVSSRLPVDGSRRRASTHRSFYSSELQPPCHPHLALLTIRRFDSELLSQTSATAGPFEFHRYRIVVKPTTWTGRTHILKLIRPGMAIASNPLKSFVSTRRSRWIQREHLRRCSLSELLEFYNRQFKVIPAYFCSTVELNV